MDTVLQVYHDPEVLKQSRAKQHLFLKTQAALYRGGSRVRAKFPCLSSARGEGLQNQEIHLPLLSEVPAFPGLSPQPRPLFNLPLLLVP